MKHTPGPWKIESESPRGPDGSDLVITNNDGSYTIARCISGDTGVPDVEAGEANARLIAAAPALLEAAKRALEVFVPGPNWGAAQRQLEAAIALVSPEPAEKEGA